MEELAKILIAIGGILLIGFITDLIGKNSPLPRVTLLLVIGVAIGPSGLDIFPDVVEHLFPYVTHMALLIVGFLLGEKLTLSSLRENGKTILWISIAEVITTAFITAVGLLLVGVRIDIALLLAGIATATAPAATTDVVREIKAEGKFSDTLLGIVAVDDAWGIIVFSVMLAIAQAFNSLHGQGGGNESILLLGLWEVGGAILVGIMVGIPMSFLTGRIKAGEPTLAEAMGMIFLCGGIAILLDVSFLLAAMTLGAFVANFAKHYKRPFYTIKGIDWPFMILFFVLAGASLHLSSLSAIGLIGTAYVALRVAGRFAGSWIGGSICNADNFIRKWMGMALMPQAGVALGMALVASQTIPAVGDIILPTVIAATVVFEIFGPVLTRRALILSGEAGAAASSETKTDHLR